MSKILLFEAIKLMAFFFFSSRRRHTKWNCHWSSDVCSSDLAGPAPSPGSALVKEGWFGPGNPLHARVEIRDVERLGARSALRFTVTSLESETRHTGNAFGTARSEERRVGEEWIPRLCASQE